MFIWYNIKSNNFIDSFRNNKAIVYGCRLYNKYIDEAKMRIKQKKCELSIWKWYSFHNIAQSIIFTVVRTLAVQ